MQSWGGWVGHGSVQSGLVVWHGRRARPLHVCGSSRGLTRGTVNIRGVQAHCASNIVFTELCSSCEDRYTHPTPHFSLFIAVGAFSRKRRQNAREDNGNFNLLFTGRMRATSPQSAMGFRTHLLSRPLGWHTVLPNKLTFVTVSVQLGRPVRLRSTPAKRPCPPQTVPLKNGRKSPQLLFSYNSSLTQTSTLTTTTNG